MTNESRRFDRDEIITKIAEVKEVVTSAISAYHGTNVPFLL